MKVRLFIKHESYDAFGESFVANLRLHPRTAREAQLRHTSLDRQGAAKSEQAHSVKSEFASTVVLKIDLGFDGARVRAIGRHVDGRYPREGPTDVCKSD